MTSFLSSMIQDIAKAVVLAQTSAHPCNKAATEAASASSSLLGECKICGPCSGTDDCCGEGCRHLSRLVGATSSGERWLNDRARGVAPADPGPYRTRVLPSTLEYT